MSKIVKTYNAEVVKRTAKRCKERGIIIPTFAQMRHPETAPEAVKARLKNVGLWDIDPAKRKIQILPVNKWEELAAGKMPAVVYADLGQNFQRLTIGDQFYTNPETYAEGYVRSCSGSHRFMCVADTDAAAVMLVGEGEARHG